MAPRQDRTVQSERAGERGRLIDPICRIRHCAAEARYNLVTAGHPNGDVAVSYCAEHIRSAPGHWEDSPASYSITVTGPIGGARG